MTKTRAYELTLLEIAGYIRDSLRDVEDIDSFIFSIDMSGRVDGEILISMDLRHSYKYGFDVKGASNIDELLAEFKRRFGWIQKNKQLLLPSNVKQIEGDNPENLPF